MLSYQLNTPHIVQFYGYFIDNGGYCTLMKEYQYSLADMLQKEQAIPVASKVICWSFIGNIF